MSVYSRDKQFSEKMQPYVDIAYDNIWPGCATEDLRKDGANLHELDISFGVDRTLRTRDGCLITVQQKVRRPEAYKYQDFTQEYRNAVGTPYESDGEWFKLASTHYFYGWSNKRQNGLEDWFILDVQRYKRLVELAGGLDKIGKYHRNEMHGRASFYSIKHRKLETAKFADKKRGIIPRSIQAHMF